MQNPKETSAQQDIDCCELKIDKISPDDLRRNDLIFHQNDIWRCQSLNMRLFQNLQTKQQINIPQDNNQQSQWSYSRIQRLELIPKQWKHSQVVKGENQETITKIMLKGQELGLGPLHEVEVVGMRHFQELDVVKSEKEKGRNIPFKVVLCKTKKINCYLIAAVDFLT